MHARFSMRLCSPLVALLDDGARGAAKLRARADFELARSELRRRSAGGSTWELRVVSRDPFQPMDFAVAGVQRDQTWLDRLDLTGADGIIELRDVVIVGDALHPNLTVKRLAIAGFRDEPWVRDDGGMLLVYAYGMAASLRGARVERSSSRLTVVTWGEAA
jgi:hypothetical protein